MTEVLGDIEFEFYYRRFDTIFLLSSLSYIVFLIILEKIRFSLDAEGDFKNK
jgi:hypothetical protein